MYGHCGSPLTREDNLDSGRQSFTMRIQCLITNNNVMYIIRPTKVIENGRWSVQTIKQVTLDTELANE